MQFAGPHSALARGLRGLRWCVLIVCLGIASLFAGWHALAAGNFGYALWYDLLDIEQTIATYGPVNEIRPGFEETERAERERLFAAIVDAIHDDGDGLGTLVYHDPAGEPLGHLLTDDEIVHLEDVAHLINTFTLVNWVAVAACLLLAGAALLRGEPPPSGKRVAVTMAGILFGGGAIVWLAGPVRVFYWLHEVLFPPEHEWFFYYEESLMAQMMQAPNLFGPIAVSWVGFALAIGFALWVAFTGLLRRRVAHARS